MFKSTRSSTGITNQLLALSCFGLLVAGGISGCGGGDSNTTQDQVKKEDPLKIQITQVDELSKLADKPADGQYMVVKFNIKNVSNQPMQVDPNNFVLQFMAKDEKQQYTQSYEKNVGNEFNTAYGDENKDKLMVWATDINPRIELERYFVFMVPSDASAEQYQLVYTDPASPTSKIIVPLVTPGTTIVNDHRSELPSSTTPPAEQ